MFNKHFKSLKVIINNIYCGCLGLVADFSDRPHEHLIRTEAPPSQKKQKIFQHPFLVLSQNTESETESLNNSAGQAGAEGEKPKLFLRFFSLNTHSLN